MCMVIEWGLFVEILNVLMRLLKEVVFLKKINK